MMFIHISIKPLEYFRSSYNLWKLKKWIDSAKPSSEELEESMNQQCNPDYFKQNETNLKITSVPIQTDNSRFVATVLLQ